VLVADSRQPVRCRAFVGAGLAVEALRRLVVCREHGHLGDLERRHPGLRLGGGAAALSVRRGHEIASGRGALGGSGHDDGRVLLEDAQPDLLDLVAECRRSFELELTGGGLHLCLHLPDELLDPRAIELVEVDAALPRVHDRRLCNRPQPLVEVVDALDDRRGLDAAFVVVRLLHRASAVRLVDRSLHRFGDRVGVHDHLAADVPRGPPDHLNQRPGRAQEALLVGVEDRDERDLGQVDPLAQEIDADEHVVDAEPEVAQDRDPLERVDLAVQVLDLDAELLEVVGQILGHLLREGRDQRTLTPVDS
jgi:hypothetical protein